MKINEGFVVREVGGKIVAVATGEASKDFNGMITLNEVGRFLFEALKSETTVEELLEKVCGEYEVDRETAKKDIEMFIDKLKEANILQNA